MKECVRPYDSRHPPYAGLAKGVRREVAAAFEELDLTT